jgi:DNA polymerase III delta prime subunit
MSNYWVEKYRPTKLSDIITNIQATKEIYSWVSSFEKNKKDNAKNIKKNYKKNKTEETGSGRKKKILCKSCLLITGNHGVGKTVTVEIVLKELGYLMKKIDITSLKSIKNIKDVVNTTIKSTNILNMIQNKPSNKIAIVIDEIESFTSSTEKGHIMTLQKLNEVEWFCPIIFISNSKHNKLLSGIKKSLYEIKMYQPYPSDMRKILIKITQTEKIQIKNEAVIGKIISHSQGDIRRLIITLQDIKYAYNESILTDSVIDNYCKYSKAKDIDIELYKATNELLYNYKNIDQCLKLFETQKVLLPLMIHQNYLNMVMTNCNEDLQYDIINDISETLSIGDVIENHIYGDQNWELQEIHCYCTCVLPSYIINKNIVDNQKINISFASDLNKTSIKRINNKNIKNTERCFANMNIGDYIYINKIIKKYINDNNTKDCMNLFKDYNIKLENIESLLKVDKIKNSKNNLTQKQKKEIINFSNKI